MRSTLWAIWLLVPDRPLLKPDKSLRRVTRRNTIFIFAELTADFALQFGNFLQTSRVATLLKWSLQPDSNHLISKLIAQLISGQANHVGVIVHATVFRRDAVMARCCADTGEFIRGDTHADTSAADQDTAIDLSIGYLAGDLSGVVRIVNALQFEWAKVLDVAIQALQKLGEARLQLHAAMITSDADFHMSLRIFPEQFIDPKSQVVTDLLCTTAVIIQSSTDGVRNIGF